MEKSVQTKLPEAEHEVPCEMPVVQGVGVPPAADEPADQGGSGKGQTGKRTAGSHEGLPPEKENGQITKEEKSMRKNAMCDMECEFCTRPADRCYGGGKRGSMKVAKYHKMTDGKRGKDMPDIAMGRGGKRWH
jgi:hypothetical protein